MESSSDEMQLYLKANDVITLTWLPRELVPSFLSDEFEGLLIAVGLYQQTLSLLRGSDWIFVSGSTVGGFPNSGSAQYTIPGGLDLQECGDDNQLLCPIVFRLSATVPIPGGSDTTEVAIWSAVAYLQSDGATAMSLSELCNDWFTPEPPATTNPNEIQGSVLNSLPMCPPTLAQATADNRFRRETMESAMSDLASGYSQAAMKFYYPEASVCFVEIVMEERFVS